MVLNSFVTHREPPWHSRHVTRHMSHVTHYTSLFRWHAVIDAVKIMKLSAEGDVVASGGAAAATPSAGGTGGAAAAATPSAAAPHLQVVAPVDGGDELVGVGLSIHTDMTVSPFRIST